MTTKPPVLRKKPAAAAKPAPPPPPAPVAATPAPPPVVDYTCPVKGCTERVPQKGFFCKAHWEERRAKAYYAPETGPFTCTISGCDVEVPHRETMCGRHWTMVSPKDRYRIKHFSRLFHVLLGLAIEEVGVQEAAAKGHPPVAVAPAVIDEAHAHADRTVFDSVARDAATPPVEAPETSRRKATS